MKCLIVADSAIASKLEEQGFRVLQRRTDVDRVPLWVFEYSPALETCFDFRAASDQGACVVSDSLTMCFSDGR